MQPQPAFALCLMQKIQKAAKTGALVQGDPGRTQKLPDLAQVERAIRRLLKMWWQCLPQGSQ
jgi:hypothetical protein